MSRVALLFPGQGAQKVGMGQQLHATLPAAKALFDRARDVLGYDLAEICFQGPAATLDSTIYSQPALYVTSAAALEWLRVHVPQAVEHCTAVAGLSLGEYTAMYFAGVFDFEEGLHLVQQRGEAMQQASDQRPSGMVSVLGLEAEAVEKLCDQCRQPGEILQIANLLCPGNIAVSGDRAACERIAEQAAGAGAMKAIPLAVAGAFHTPIMDSAVAKLEAALARVAFAAPRVPVVSNVDAQPHDDPEQLRRLLIRQVVSPVLWQQSLQRLLADQVDRFYEVGPGRVLAGLLKRIDRKMPCESVVC